MMTITTLEIQRGQPRFGTPSVPFPKLYAIADDLALVSPRANGGWGQQEQVGPPGLALALPVCEQQGEGGYMWISNDTSNACGRANGITVGVLRPDRSRLSGWNE